MSKFAQYLLAFRQEKFLTQKDMATILGYSSPYLSSMEKGKRRIPNTFLLSFCDKFKLLENDKLELDAIIQESNASYELDRKKSVDEVIKQLVSWLVQMGSYAKNNVDVSLIAQIKQQIIEVIERFVSGYNQPKLV